MDHRLLLAVARADLWNFPIPPTCERDYRERCGVCVAASPGAIVPDSATMPSSHQLGDVTSLLSVKVRPRLNKGLNHCHRVMSHCIQA